MQKEFRLFISDDLHYRAKVKAAEERISLNQFFIEAAEIRVGLVAIEDDAPAEEKI